MMDRSRIEGRGGHGTQPGSQGELTDACVLRGDVRRGVMSGEPASSRQSQTNLRNVLGKGFRHR